MDAEKLALQGWDAVRTMLDMIGDPEATDHDVAKLLVSNELAIRKLLSEIRNGISNGKYL